MKLKNIYLLIAFLFGFNFTALGGPIILAGTDADDHGGATATANLTGWLFMQRVLENLASAASLTNGHLNVVNLGSSGSALNAATSAFGFSSLAGTWSFTNIDGDAAITDYFAGNGAVNINNTGIIMMDSGSHVSGGSSVSERNLFTTNAGIIDTFLANGGGLFSQSNGYAWVNALLPGLTIVNGGGTGANLTAAGMAAFPGLTNGDLTSGPRHNRFSNIGGLTVLATDNSGIAVIIGTNAGSITNPGQTVPEPTTLAIFALGLLGLASRRVKKKA
ncbi:PEP-CTERM protein-sorting domain-containing protein [Colwellia chukchiensis]|uniref:PEP-CTERM protein-sorting domain-containing protein n=1 Tax=Colwellia chukchiensis TaxID=641665 RepID=A0A1H7MVF6_9GAMM|nr:PEP-CTERM sorting domain-containing protein [Colwellia chukchiensis]SEL15204.1 PEP-CTERM protein-sorting domain-containing protein [Colwellia chukchiensis]